GELFLSPRGSATCGSRRKRSTPFYRERWLLPLSHARQSGRELRCRSPCQILLHSSIVATKGYEVKKSVFVPGARLSPVGRRSKRYVVVKIVGRTRHGR